MEKNCSDADLARQVAASRDRESEDALLRRFAPRVRLYGRRHLRDESAAEDLVQQVLLITLEALRAGKLREPAKIASFVLGTCRMTVLDFRRSAFRRERLLQELGGHTEIVQLPASPEYDPTQLAHCVQSLKERDRTVVVMSFYDEHKGADIAATLGISDSNVRIIRHRAIRQLLACMGGSE